MFFESNGIPRVVEVVDTTAADSANAGGSAKAARDKANPTDDGSVGAPMAGEVIDVKIKPGARAFPPSPFPFSLNPKPQKVIGKIKPGARAFPPSPFFPRGRRALSSWSL